MPNFETFSKRKKRLERAGKQDIYQYDVLPHEFRIQVIHIWRGALGRYFVPRGFNTSFPSEANHFWNFIHDTIARESGLAYLGNTQEEPDSRCISYLVASQTDQALDIIELSFRVIDVDVRKKFDYMPVSADVNQEPDDAIEELNHRFKEHGIGYQYFEGILVRLDSQFAHAEIVRPALSLLNAAGFEGPADEFIGAFDHYRQGRYKEAVTEALKSFESTMKSICTVKKWEYPANATAIPLIGIIFKHGLIPQELESHFSGLRSALESGLPTISNSTSRHGQGIEPKTVPPHFAAYALHLVASNIVFLVEAYKALGK